MGRKPTGQSKGESVDRSMFPNVEAFLHRPVLSEPPMCTLSQLQDGTYSIEDVAMMNELLDIKIHMKPKGPNK